MKRLFIAMMAVAALAACATEETIEASKGSAIGFANDFIDNATKSIDGTYQNNGTGVNKLTLFHVYGTVENNNGLANIFNEEAVSNETGVWAYDVNKTQYWVNGNTYDFAAVAYADAAGVTVEQGLDGMPTAIAYNATQATDGTQHDLLYAEKKDIAYKSGDATTVKFTFEHLLAKAKFTVKNQMQNGNGNSYKVTNVKVLDAVETATYKVGGTWTGHAGQHDVTFGDIVAADANAVEAALKMEMGESGASNYERLLIPQENAALKVSIDVEYYVQDKVNNADVLNDSYTKTAETVHTLEAGRAYNFIITLGNPGEAITFAVEDITDWVEEDVIVGEPVGTVAEFAAAIEKGGSYQLTSNLTLSEPLTIAEGTQLNLNLKGNTLTVENSDFINEGTLVMQDGVVSGVNTQSGRRALTNKGNLSLENVTLNQVYTPGGAALINDGASAVATLNDVTIQAENMAISNKNGATMTINGGTYVGNGTGASYSVCNQLGSTLTVNGGSFYGGHGVVASSEASVTTLNAGTYHCTATYTGNSDWVLYANGNGSVVNYDESECVLTHAVKTGVVNTTEENGQIVAF